MVRRDKNIGLPDACKEKQLLVNTFKPSNKERQYIIGFNVFSQNFHIFSSILDGVGLWLLKQHKQFA